MNNKKINISYSFSKLFKSQKIVFIDNFHNKSQLIK